MSESNTMQSQSATVYDGSASPKSALRHHQAWHWSETCPIAAKPQRADNQPSYLSPLARTQHRHVEFSPCLSIQWPWGCPYPASNPGSGSTAKPILRTAPPTRGALRHDITNGDDSVRSRCFRQRKITLWPQYVIYRVIQS